MFVVTCSRETLRTPPQITIFIKHEQYIAVGLTSGPHPEAGLTNFCAGMEGLLSRSGLRIHYIHISAISTAAAHIWTEAQRSPTFKGHADVSDRLKALFRCFLQCLQTLADLDAQAISNVLWSSFTTGFNPDDGVPGLVHGLTSKFLYFTDMKREKQWPKALEAANVLWAFATMAIQQRQHRW